jgi:C-terminal processing protease CtpA/Prc
VGSKCASPLPIVSVHYILPDGRRVIAERREDRKPRSGDIRDIEIEKTSEQLGITIEDGSNKGVFVSSVSEHSLASQVGLQVGDQLLDVCGINLRTSNKERAALVLAQVGNSIRMKVQFNPDEFHGSMEGVARRESEEEEEEEEDEEQSGINVSSDCTGFRPF